MTKGTARRKETTSNNLGSNFMFILIRSIVADSILMMDELCLSDDIINSWDYFFYDSKTSWLFVV